MKRSQYSAFSEILVSRLFVQERASRDQFNRASSYTHKRDSQALLEELGVRAKSWRAIRAILNDFETPLIDEIKTAGEATSLAIDWQNWQSRQALSYAQLLSYQQYFEALGEKFNLTDEFRENGII